MHDPKPNIPLDEFLYKMDWGIRTGLKIGYLIVMPPLYDKPERARQFARAIASDIAMYNETKVTQGIQNDSLFDVLKDEIEEGRQHFKSRVTPEIASTNLFDRALVDILLKQRGHNIKSKIW